MSKYEVISGPYFLPVFGPNTRKYEPEITPYLDTFHAVLNTLANNIDHSLIYLRSDVLITYDPKTY